MFSSTVLFLFYFVLSLQSLLLTRFEKRIFRINRKCWTIRFLIVNAYLEMTQCTNACTVSIKNHLQLITIDFCHNRNTKSYEKVGALQLEFPLVPSDVRAIEMLFAKQNTDTSSNSLLCRCDKFVAQSALGWLGL